MATGLKHNVPESLTVPLNPCQRQRAEPPCDDCGGGTQKPACAEADGEDRPFSWTPAFGFSILTVNCGAAAYHSRNDPWTVAFVLASFLVLALLFCALRVFETLPPRESSPRRARVKAAVWVLSTALTLMFSLRVAALMPFPAAVFVWVIAVSTVSAGFYMFFVCPDVAATAEEEEPAKVADIP